MSEANNEQPNQDKKGRFGLNAAEYADLKSMFRQAIAIFIAVAIALTVVALASSALGN